MLSFTSPNVNTMLPLVMSKFHSLAMTDSSRNGPVLRFEGPVCLTYSNPLERVCFDATRDANPFFHFMESMWMLAGRRDVAFVKFYNSQMAAYSDDGEVFNAAYGYRMRRHFGVDQLTELVEELRRDPKTRQAVINLWAPSDLSKTTKDKACNLSLLFAQSHVTGRLDLTVYNRSNDAVWGAVTGANPVHMSYFLQFVADAAGFNPGVYHQIANNLHLYTENEKSKLVLAATSFESDRYTQGIEVPNLVDINYDRWLIEVEMFCDQAGKPSLIKRQFSSLFLNSVAIPIHNAFASRKNKDGEGTEYWLDECEDRAWAVACGEWCARRDDK
jgi:thymidylate synthase